MVEEFQKEVVALRNDRRLLKKHCRDITQHLNALQDALHPSYGGDGCVAIDGEVSTVEQVSNFPCQRTQLHRADECHRLLSLGRKLH
jgi:hypothetical protein